MLLCDYFNSFNFYRNGELSRNQTGRNGVQVKKENEKFTVVCSRSPQNFAFGHFTLLFCIGRQRNVPKCKTQVQSDCFSSLNLFFVALLSLSSSLNLPNVIRTSFRLQRIQFPTTTRKIKYKMATIAPPSPMPPHERMPSYITAFQSSPVKIWIDKTAILINLKLMMMMMMIMMMMIMMMMMMMMMMIRG